MKQFYGVLASAGVIVGLLGGVTSLIDWMQGKLSPPPPAEIDARVSAVDLRSINERLGDYLADTNLPTRGYTRDELGQEGYVFLVRVRIRGERGNRLPLRWSMHDADEQRRLRGPIYNDSPVTFTARGPDHARRWPIWVPYPPREGSYFLRVTLMDPERQPLDQRDSEAFDVAGVDL